MAEFVTLPAAARSVYLTKERPTKLRAGVVGLGKQALEDHIPGLLASDGAELVAICDEDAEIVHEQQYKLRVAGYTDFVDMFRAEQLDLVSSW
ncbi:MAG: Gfo/Idh/MocA family oxidoreductase [Pseudonocardiaceae bacterium]